MRVLAAIVVLLFVAAGVVVGALNAEAVTFDLWFVQVRWPKGVALLIALVVGWLLGGLTAWIGSGIARRTARRRGGNGPAARP